MYEADEVDFLSLHEAPLAWKVRLREAFPDECVLAPEGKVFYILFDVTRAPFRDPRVRRAFAYALDRIVPTRTWGPVTVDIAYGGAFYAFLSADSIGLDLSSSPMRAIVDAGEEIAEAAAKAVPIVHADEPDLAFLYGTILTDGGNGVGRPSRNVCIFAGRQIDRSPTGSGVTARMALHLARREAKLGDERRFESCTGDVFSGRAVLSRSAC